MDYNHPTNTREDWDGGGDPDNDEGSDMSMSDDDVPAAEENNPSLEDSVHLASDYWKPMTNQNVTVGFSEEAIGEDEDAENDIYENMDVLIDNGTDNPDKVNMDDYESEEFEIFEFEAESETDNLDNVSADEELETFEFEAESETDNLDNVSADEEFETFEFEAVSETDNLDNVSADEEFETFEIEPEIETDNADKTNMDDSDCEILAVIPIEDESEKAKEESSVKDKNAVPVCVIVNNVPKDTSVEILKSYFPTASKVQIPRLNQSSNFPYGHAVLEFPNSNEATKVYINNYRIPTKIGERTLTLAVLGLDINPDQPIIAGGDDGPILKGYDVFVGQMSPKARKKEVYDFFTQLFETHGLCERGEKPIQEIKFLPRRTFQFVSFHKKADALACVRKFQNVTFKAKTLNIKPGKNIEADYLEILQTDKKNSHGENNQPIIAGGDKGPKFSYHVFVGQMPNNVNKKEVYDFFTQLFVTHGLCERGEKPIKKVDFKYERTYQFVWFHKKTDALACVRKFQNVTFKGKTLNIKPAKNFEGDYLEISQTDKKNSHRENNQPIIAGGDDGPILKSYHVFVGQLPTNAKRKDIYDFFTQLFETHGLCERGEKPIQVIDFVPKRSYQFVRFHKKADALACVRKFQHVTFMEKRLNVKPGKNIEADYLEILQTENHQPVTASDDGYHVFVGNMPTNAQKKDIYDFFTQLFETHGLCERGEKPIQEIDFEPKSSYQFVSLHEDVHPEYFVKTCNKVTEQTVDDLNCLDFKFHKKSDALECVIKFQHVRFMEKILDVKPGKNIEEDYLEIFQPPKKKPHRENNHPIKAEDDGPILNGYHVYVGQMPLDVKQKEVYDFFTQLFETHGLCERGEKPIRKIGFVPKRPYQFVTFHQKADALECVRNFQHVLFMAKRLDVKPGKNIEADYLELLQTEKKYPHRENKFAARTTRSGVENCSIYVDNLPEATYEELETFFNEQFVKFHIGSANENIILKIDFKENRKYQFVWFHKRADAFACLRQFCKNVMFKGYKLKVQPGKDIEAEYREMIQQEGKFAARTTRSGVEKCSIYVDNLPEATYEELETFFNEQFVKFHIGSANENIIQKIDFKENRKYQFVWFHKRADAFACLRQFCKNVMFKGYKLKVQPGKDIEAEYREMIQQEGKTAGIEKCSIYVENLPKATYEELETFLNLQFVKFRICSANENILLKIDFRENRTFQFVWFHKKADAFACVRKCQNVMFKGYELKVQPGKDFAEEYREMLQRKRKPATQYGDFEKCAIFIGNLPEHTCDELEDFFREQLVKFGICSANENIIHRIDFLASRKYQFVWLNKLSYATDCIQKLKGVLFKENPIYIGMGTTVVETKSTPQIRDGTITSPDRKRSISSGSRTRDTSPDKKRSRSGSHSDTSPDKKRSVRSGSRSRHRSPDRKRSGSRRRHTSPDRKRSVRSGSRSRHRSPDRKRSGSRRRHTSPDRKRSGSRSRHRSPDRKRSVRSRHRSPDRKRSGGRSRHRSPDRKRSIRSGSRSRSRSPKNNNKNSVNIQNQLRMFFENPLPMNIQNQPDTKQIQGTTVENMGHTGHRGAVVFKYSTEDQDRDNQEQQRSGSLDELEDGRTVFFGNTGRADLAVFDKFFKQELIKLRVMHCLIHIEFEQNRGYQLMTFTDRETAEFVIEKFNLTLFNEHILQVCMYKREMRTENYDKEILVRVENNVNFTESSFLGLLKFKLRNIGMVTSLRRLMFSYSLDYQLVSFSSLEDANKIVKELGDFEDVWKMKIVELVE